MTAVSYSENSSSRDSYYLGGMPRMELVKAFAVLLMRLRAPATFLMTPRPAWLSLAFWILFYLVVNSIKG